VSSLVDALNVDCRDPRLLADFWSKVLGYRPEDADEDADGESASIVPAEGATGWTMLFFVVPEGKSVKNRLHLDLSPPGTMAAEVERLVAVGATVQGRVDEGGSFWTVMLDPEGNEFCVLRGPGDDPPKARPS
jgi:predicted enzyme related to lactoylglutathione lyase